MKNIQPSRSLYTVIRYPLVDSTNRIAFDLGARGHAQGTVVLAAEQSGGRGRQSRFFCSPPGGLYMSALLRPSLPASELSLITLAAGVACAEALEMATGISVQLKWPNDLYCNDKKLGGILTEAAPYSHATGGVPFVAVGIGLNVNTRSELFPASLQDLATSLYCVTGREYDIDMVLHSLMLGLLAEVSLLRENRAQVLAHWRNRDFLLGRKLSWQDPNGKTIQGTGNGLLSDGRYRLTTTGGDDYAVLAGDISLTESKGQFIK